MDTNHKKSPKNKRYQNILEGLKEIGTDVSGSLKRDVIRPKDFMDSLFGPPMPAKKFSGEINPGEALEINDVYSGKQEETIKLQKQLALERKLKEEEKSMYEEKSNQLKLQLNALIQEVAQLAQSTQTLAEEVQVAALQAPVEPGIYHLIFFYR